MEDKKNGSKVEIVYPTPFYLPHVLGGGELTMHIFMKELAKQGFKSTVFLLGRTPSDLEHKIDNVTIYEVSHNHFQKKFHEYVAQNKPKLGFISSIDPKFSYFAFSSLKQNGAKVITYEQFYRNIYTEFQRMMDIPIDKNKIPPEGREIISKADIVMVNSDYTGLVTQRFLDRESIIVYPPIEIEKAIAKNHTREYVTLINPSQHKGRDVFLSMAKDLPNTKFMVVEMPHDKVTPEFKLPNVKVLPFQKDVSQIYKQTKVLLFPTLTDETYGRSMVEAMANGIPVIAREVGGIPYVIGRDGAGVLIQRDEPSSTWFRELEKLLTDQNYYNDMSAKAFSRAKVFNYNTEVGKVKTIIDNVLEGKSFSEIPIETKIEPDEDDIVVNKLDEMDVHDDFINDDGTTVKTQNLSPISGKEGDYDVISLSPFFPSVREILINITKGLNEKNHSAAYADFVLPKAKEQVQGYLLNIANAILEIKPKLLILGSWIPYYTGIVSYLKKNNCPTKIAISWHSNFSQMELSPDREVELFTHLCALLDKKVLDYLFMSDEYDSELLSHTLHPNIKWLPDFLNLDDIKSTEKINLEQDRFHTSLFAFPTARKNILAQVSACRAVKNCHLHINNFQNKGPHSLPYLRFINALKIQHTHHGWMEKQRYLNLISSVDVGLQVTMAETFSIVAAEHMVLGVPCLVSPMVPIIKGSGLEEHLVINDINSAKDIASKLAILRNEPDLRKEIGEKSRTHIISLNNRHKNKAIELISSIVSQ